MRHRQRPSSLPFPDSSTFHYFCCLSRVFFFVVVWRNYSNGVETTSIARKSPYNVQCPFKQELRLKWYNRLNCSEHVHFIQWQGLHKKMWLQSNRSLWKRKVHFIIKKAKKEIFSTFRIMCISKQRKNLQKMLSPRKTNTQKIVTKTNHSLETCEFYSHTRAKKNR